jgi:integrase
VATESDERRCLTRLVRPPRVPHAEMRTLNRDQIRTLLVASEHDRLGPLWHVAIASGARLGELLALTWDRVDFDRGSIRITRTMTRTEPDTRWGSRRLQRRDAPSRSARPRPPRYVGIAPRRSSSVAWQVARGTLASLCLAMRSGVRSTGHTWRTHAVLGRAALPNPRPRFWKTSGGSGIWTTTIRELDG